MSDTEKPMKQKEALEIFKDLFNSRDYSEPQKMEAIEIVLGDWSKFYKRVSKDDYFRATKYLYLVVESHRNLLEFTFGELAKNGYTSEILKEKLNAYREKNKQAEKKQTENT